MSVLVRIYVGHGDPGGLGFANLGLGLALDFIRRNPLAHSRNRKIFYTASKFGRAFGKRVEAAAKRFAINEHDMASNLQLWFSFGQIHGVLKCLGISHERS